MIGVEFKIDFYQPKRVTDAADKASFKNLGHAASRIRNDAIASIKPGPVRKETLPSGRVVTRKVPSPPGTPPFTHTQRLTKKGKIRKGNIQRAIVFYSDKAKQEAIVGPRFSVIGESGKAHELGGEYKGQEYPERAYMGPALAKNLDRFAAGMAASIGS